MVTALKHALWNQKVNQSRWDSSDSVQVFYLALCVCSSRLRWIAVFETADPWLPPFPPSSRISSHATSSSPSSGRLCPSISIIGLSCIHLSADASWYEVAGRRGTEAFPLQVPSLPISPLLLLFLLFYHAILFGSVLLFFPSGTFHRHIILYTNVLCSQSHTLALALGAVLRYVSVSNQ